MSTVNCKFFVLVGVDGGRLTAGPAVPVGILDDGMALPGARNVCAARWRRLARAALAAGVSRLPAVDDMFGKARQR